ncbi:MAG: HlyD family efflux transporter periplasmic adaptor subunit [Alphaproteobacteria bacterium]|nr:HlyD family efflux transporter periplasmic adaptor subunit [Alphaproteobacteria bacterium]
MKTRILIAALLINAGMATPLFAHAGHDAAPGDDASGAISSTIMLSEATIKNLGIETSPATLAPLGKALEMNATVEYLPENYANITSKANGAISNFHVKLGDAVKKGQTLLSFTPVFVGSSPVSLTSPINGFVVKQNAVIGQAITPETVIMEVADTTQVLVKGVTYSPNDFEQIKTGQKVSVSMGHSGAPLSGVVQRLDVGSSKENRTFGVYALVNNPSRMLFANTAATLSIVFGEAQDVLTVPAKAVLGELGNYFLFVREGNNFERRNVVLGQKSAERIEIIDGVLPDEDVVTVGNYQLQYAKSQAPAKSEGSH